MDAPRRILLVNPNGSRETTALMVGLAQAEAGPGYAVAGATATRAPTMIVDAAALAASEPEVVAMARDEVAGAAGLIVAAFGDPGLDAVRRGASVPAVGIAESAMREAAAKGRRFGIATVTPGLVEAIEARVRGLGLAHLHTGIRLTQGDPVALAADPERLRAALAGAVEASIRDGAEAVIIGGGPLGRAARELAPLFAVPIVAPIAAAVRHLKAAIGTATVS